MPDLKQDNHLNKSQLEAAKHIHGPALIVAGPGTGKTTTLVTRFGNLVESGIAPESIITVTHTTAAAEEMKVRLTKRLGSSLRHLTNISTIHSLAYRLDRFAAKRGLLPEAWQNPKVVQNYEVAKLLSVSGIDNDDHEQMKTIIERMKAQRMSATERRQYIASLEEPPEGDLGKVFDAYTKYLERTRKIDFTDQLLTAVEVLDDDGMRDLIHNRYSHLMVDEFQDINNLQMEFLSKLLNSNQNIWAVGDDDQSIFGFAGGNPRFMTDFKNNYPGAVYYQLDTTYRFGSDILACTQRLIQHNTIRIPKTFKCASNSTGKCDVQIYDSDEIEAATIAELIRGKIDGGEEAHNIAILARCSFVHTTIAGELRKLKIPYFFPKELHKYWNHKIIKHALQLFANAIHYPWNSDSQPDNYYYQRLQSVLGDVKSLSTAVVAKNLKARTGSILNPRESGQSEQDSIAALSRLSGEIQGYDTLEAFLNDAKTAIAQLKTKGTPENCIALETIHSAKGREWSTVFCPGLEEDIIPYKKSKNLEEERRLAYVAISRTKSELYVSLSKVRNGRSQTPSRYLLELLPDQAKSLELKKQASKPGFVIKKSSAAKTTPARMKSVSQKKKRTLDGIGSDILDNRIGERVEHHRFGHGTVIAVKSTKKMVVQFNLEGRKTILTTHLSFFD